MRKYETITWLNKTMLSHKIICLVIKLQISMMVCLYMLNCSKTVGGEPHCMCAKSGMQKKKKKISHFKVLSKILCGTWWKLFFFLTKLSQCRYTPSERFATIIRPCSCKNIQGTLCHGEDLGVNQMQNLVFQDLPENQASRQMTERQDTLGRKRCCFVLLLFDGVQHTVPNKSKS